MRKEGVTGTQVQGNSCHFYLDSKLENHKKIIKK